MKNWLKIGYEDNQVFFEHNYEDAEAFKILIFSIFSSSTAGLVLDQFRLGLEKEESDSIADAFFALDRSAPIIKPGDWK